MSGRIHLPSSGVYGISGRATVPACHGDSRLFRVAVLLKCPAYSPKNASFSCNSSSPNSNRRNPDFSRQQRGSSKGKSRRYHERDHSENIEESDLMSSRNGPLLSLTSNPRYQATAAPGRREKEIVELFRKVQEQLRDRAAIREEKKIEAAQRGQGERGTVDSLLKLLRKHSVDQRKKSSTEVDYNTDQPERGGNAFEDEQNSSYGSNRSTQEELQEPDPVSFSRPASNFSRRSPVPRVKFQPVFSTDEDVNPALSLKKTHEKNASTAGPEPVLPLEPESLDDPEDDMFLDDQPESCDNQEAQEEIEEPSAAGSPDVGSLKLSELREIAKSRGIKGYSKLKKGELVLLLSGEAA